MASYCCPECFNDNFLKKEIKIKSSSTGKCSFCQTENISVLDPKELSDFFTPVLDLYEYSKGGKSLFKILQEDWEIFNLTETNQNKLLYEITSKDANITYHPIYEPKKQNIKEWENFGGELEHRNRFFPKNAPTIDTIRPFGKFLGIKLEKRKHHFWRARLNFSENPIEIKNMGKPPVEFSTNGRANPIGISYLYLASKPETAIAEIRGHKGETVTVARFEIVKDLELFDLRNPKRTVTPFGLDDDELQLIYENLPFLEFLGNELSKPIIPREANLEYIPSQYLSEIVKHIGFHGIIYNSSVASGYNLVLFDDSRVEPIESQQYKITDVITKSQKIIF